MKSIIFFLFSMVASFTLAQTGDPVIIQKPINYSKERIKLSIDYLKRHYSINQNSASISPKIIVLHYTSGGTLETNFKYFNKTYLEQARSGLKEKSLLNVSSHYIVDRDGTIYQLIKPELFARHIIGLNYCAVGIENIGSKKQPLTDQQVVSNAQLVRYLKKKYKIEYLIGHSEYGEFRNSELWKEKDPDYFTLKDDPGVDFMKKVRLLVSGLHLKYRP